MGGSDFGDGVGGRFSAGFGGIHLSSGHEDAEVLKLLTYLDQIMIADGVFH